MRVEVGDKSVSRVDAKAEQSGMKVTVRWPVHWWPAASTSPPSISPPARAGAGAALHGTRGWAGLGWAGLATPCRRTLTGKLEHWAGLGWAGRPWSALPKLMVRTHHRHTSHEEDFSSCTHTTDIVCKIYLDKEHLLVILTEMKPRLDH